MVNERQIQRGSPIKCFISNNQSIHMVKSSFLTWLIFKRGKKSVAVDCFHKVQFHFIMCILRGLVLLWKRGTQARGNIMTIISTNVMKN